LPQVDRVIMMLNGEVVEIGAYEELLNRRGHFSAFMELYLQNKDSVREEDEAEVADEKKAIQSPEKGADKKQEKIVDKKVKEKAGEIIAKEKIEQGKVKASVFVTYFKACGYIFTAAAVFIAGLSTTAQIGSNVWLGQWSNDAKNGENNTFWRLGIYALLGFTQCIISISNLSSKFI
jgi:hypothetical protein